MFFRCCPSVYIYLYVYINSPLPKHSPPSRPFICFRTAAFGHPAHDNSFVHLPRDQVDKATGDARWTRVNDGGWWWYWLLMMTNDGKWMLLIYWWLMMVDDDSWCLMFGTLVLISMTLCQNTACHGSHRVLTWPNWRCSPLKDTTNELSKRIQFSLWWFMNIQKVS